MSTSTSLATSATSRWYGQGGAADVTRLVEGLFTLSPTPASAGVVTAGRDGILVSFTSALKTPLPNPWRPANSAMESTIDWDAIGKDSSPDPEHPVYLVAVGIDGKGDLLTVNLAALARLRIVGHTDTTVAVATRWILELLTTHPESTIGVTPDVWPGPWTTRIKPVTAGSVPTVDVLICGPTLSYSDRSQIVSRSASPIMVDLGDDAALDAKWTISCTAEHAGELSSSTGATITTTLIVPTTTAIDRCRALVGTLEGDQPDPGPAAAGDLDDDTATDDESEDYFDDHHPAEQAGTNPGDDQAWPTADPADELHAGIDFFAAVPATAPAEQHDGDEPEPATGTDTAVSPPPSETVADSAPQFADVPAADVPAADDAPAGGAIEPVPPAAVPRDLAAAVPNSAEVPDRDSSEPVQVTPIWNRILGQIDLTPPNSTQDAGDREKRLIELTIYLQTNRWASADDIIAAVYGGAASAKTVTQLISVLRKRLGETRPGGPKALPPMADGTYRLDPVVRSDWMEFERLVEIIIEATPTPRLLAALDLVTGPPLGGIPPKAWTWTADLRDEIRSRVGGAAAAAARRLLDRRDYAEAANLARKGIWYDPTRQDLWQIALAAALDGHDDDTFKLLRSQYLSAVPAEDRDPTVLQLAQQEQ